MPDIISEERRSYNMSRIRSKDSKPELVVRRLSHSLGYRHRLYGKKLPGKPDLVYPGRKKVIFVHGCFWHQHMDPGCKIARRPKSNLGYWIPKLERNVERDARNREKLRATGWAVMVVWECQAREAQKKGPGKLAARLKEFLD